MSKTNQLKISQCMIVKNEEKNIRQALSWGKGIVAEQIVVDTGSTDQTAEIAQEMGARVYSFTWINDFSAAKNFAISKARYGWIAFLDADEYFREEDRKKILPLIKKLQPHPCDGIMTALLNVNNAGEVTTIDTQIRIFRNQPDIRYGKKVHERIMAADGRNLKIWDAVNDLSIIHTGYGEKELAEKRESKRNLHLLQAELAETPDDYEMYGYLGNEYESLGEWDKAKEAYEKAVSLIPEHMHGQYYITTSRCVFRFLELLTVRPEVTEGELLHVYQQAVLGWPEEGDYDYVIGNYYANQENYREAEKYLKQALEKLERYGNSQRSSLISAKIMKAYELLSMCCLNNGNIADCAKYATALLKENPYLMTTAMLLISAFYRDMANSGRKKEGAEEVAALLGKSFYNFQSLKDRLFVLRAAMAAGYWELVEVIRRLFTPEELEQVDRALGK